VTDVYTDVVGSLAPPAWPRSYDEVISHRCPACGARSYEVCAQPNGAPRRMPCVARI
jgi:hypothetical protein